VTDTDPIEELSDTLYNALYAITPYAEPHFADEGEGLKKAVRAVLTQAAAQQWIQKQLDETGSRHDSALGNLRRATWGGEPDD
jgi:hypothetical protein